MRDPVFVFGAMRSGTTVFRLMLDRHAQLANPGEVDFLFDHLSRTADGDWRYDFPALRAQRIFAAKKLDTPDGLDGEALLRCFVDQLTQRTTPRRLTLNIHRNATKAAQFFPDAKFIHVLRDPRDVARSSIGMGWAADLYGGVDHWIETETDWSRVAPSLTPERVCELRYEHLFSDIEAALRRVCAFIGVDYTPEMLEYHRDSNYGPPDPALIDQWRRRQDPLEIGLLEGKAGALMQARGYALSGHPVRHPSAIEAMRRSVRSRLFRLRRGVNEFGLLMVATEKLTRWVGLRGINARLRRRMNAIVAARLK